MKRCFVAIYEPSPELSCSTKFFDVRIGESAREHSKLNKIYQIARANQEKLYFQIRSLESSTFFYRALDSCATSSILMDSSQFLYFLENNIQSFQTPQSYKNPCQNLKSLQDSAPLSSFRN